MTEPVLIAGPTASGKSALALALARRGGVVVNADAMQVLGCWRVLTARPSAEEEAEAPHRLYGHVAPDADYSVGAWLRDLDPVLAECRARGLRPILVGGTGLYFKALTEGLVEMPPVPSEIRARLEAERAAEGLAALAARLRAEDPATAAQTDLANPARVVRALEALEATGRGLAAWRAETPAPRLPLSAARALVIEPDRETLYARCDARFGAMLEAGAVDEARAVAALNLSPRAPALKPVGAPDLIAHVRGEIALDEAAERARTATRRYAKRQMTWFRNQTATWPRFASAEAALAAFG